LTNISTPDQIRSALRVDGLSRGHFLTDARISSGRTFVLYAIVLANTPALAEATDVQDFPV